MAYFHGLWLGVVGPHGKRELSGVDLYLNSKDMSPEAAVEQARRGAYDGRESTKGPESGANCPEFLTINALASVD